MATVREPHSWDLCVTHASRITAPRGWELVRHSGPLPTHPEDEDLVALANAVREGSADRGASAGWYPPAGSPLSASAEPGARLLVPTVAHAKSNGRRRGHLRVLPDPAD